MTVLSDRARWKNVELGLARMLGGDRVPVTGRARGDVPDIRHSWLCVEVKSWARIPQLVTKALAQATACTLKPSEAHKLPIAILHERGRPLRSSVVVMGLGDFLDWFGDDVAENEREVTSEDVFRQPAAEGL